MALQEEDLTVPVHMVHDKVLRDSLLKVVLASHLKVLRDLDQMELLSKVALTYHHLHLLQVVMLLQLTDQNQLVRLLLPTDHHPLALLKDLQQLQPNLLALLQLDHNPLAHHLLVLKEASPMDLVLQAHHPLVSGRQDQRPKPSWSITCWPSRCQTKRPRCFWSTTRWTSRRKA